MRNENLLQSTFSILLHAFSGFFSESIHVRWVSNDEFQFHATFLREFFFNLTANIFLKSSCISSLLPSILFLHLALKNVACSRRYGFVYSAESFFMYSTRISSNCLHLYELKRKKSKTFRRYVEEQVNIRI